MTLPAVVTYECLISTDEAGLCLMKASEGRAGLMKASEDRAVSPENE